MEMQLIKITKSNKEGKDNGISNKKKGLRLHFKNNFDYGFELLTKLTMFYLHSYEKTSN